MQCVRGPPTVGLPCLCQLFGGQAGQRNGLHQYPSVGSVVLRWILEESRTIPSQTKTTATVTADAALTSPRHVGPGVPDTDRAPRTLPAGPPSPAPPMLSAHP